MIHNESLDRQYRTKIWQSNAFKFLKVVLLAEKANVEFENSEWKFKLVIRFAGVSFGATCTAVLLSVQHQHMESFFLADDLCRFVEICRT